jgi:hypothetical protein
MSIRFSSEEAFDHVLHVVLAQGLTSPLKRSLLKHGFKDIHAFHMLDDCIIDSLTYDSLEGGDDVPISASDKTLAANFLEYIVHRHCMNDPIKDNWKTVTKDDFDEFRRTTANLIQPRRFLNMTPGLAPESKQASCIESRYQTTTPHIDRETRCNPQKEPDTLSVENHLPQPYLHGTLSGNFTTLMILIGDDAGSTDLVQARAKRNGHGVKKGSHDIMTVIEASVLSLIPPPSVPHRFSRTSIEMGCATLGEIFMPWERGKLNTPVHSVPQAKSIEDDLTDNLDFIPVRNGASHQFRSKKLMELSSTHKVIEVSNCCPRWVHVRQDSSLFNQKAFPCLRLSLPKDVTPHFTRHVFTDIA